MTRENQSKLLGEFYAEKKNVMKLKGEDYANEDVLSNFKTAGGNCGISSELQCLSLIATKVARLGNLLSGKTPNNESISDSILDLSNYTDLLYCLVNEELETENNEPKTKRWENVKPKQKSILKEMMAQDEKDGLYEPITEPYEPKIGDRFINNVGEVWEIARMEVRYLTLLNDNNGDLTQKDLFIRDFHYFIQNGHLKKIN